MTLHTEAKSDTLWLQIYSFFFTILVQTQSVTLTVFTVKTSVTKITSKRKEEEDEWHVLYCTSLKDKKTDLALTSHTDHSRP